MSQPSSADSISTDYNQLDSEDMYDTCELTSASSGRRLHNNSYQEELQMPKPSAANLHHSASYKADSTLDYVTNSLCPEDMNCYESSIADL